MRNRHAWPVGVTLVVTSVASRATAEPCAPVRLGATVEKQPQMWRQAADELREATGRGEEPWSCSGGALEVVAHDDGATMVVATEGGDQVTRHVDTPDDLVALGKAILARPLPSAAPAVTPANPPAPAPTQPRLSTVVNAPPRAPAKLGQRQEPRFLVSALAGPRYAGSANSLLGSLSASVGVPLGAWVPGAWFRFDGPLAKLDDNADPTTELSLGASFGRVFKVGVADVMPDVLGSVAIVLPLDGPDTSDDAHVAGRFGVDTRVAFPRTSLFRALVGADAELAPQELVQDRHRHHEEGSPRAFPSYTVGLSFGVELAPR